jgi:tRNA(Ile)-lysidine synthetase-like protein
MEPVLAALARAIDSDLAPLRAPILLAVSGGADSMALLYGCAELAPETGWRLTVGHVHHGLRGREAGRDLSFVAEHARRLGLPFLERRVDARAAARRLRLSIEAGARHVRYEALLDMAREAGAPLVATAHQKDDVAESHRMARGRRGGTARLAGPLEKRRDGVVRPLLAVSREEILAFLASRGIGYRRDASNGDLRLDRNRARREIAAAPEDRRERLAASAAKHVAARARLDEEFERRVRPRLHFGPGATLADAAFLADCPRDLARRAISEAAAPFARPGHPSFTGRERESILDRLAAGQDFRFEAGRRIRVERRGGLLRVAGSPAASPAAARRV